jgi:hypothetical protein
MESICSTTIPEEKEFESSDLLSFEQLYSPWREGQYKLHHDILLDETVSDSTKQESLKKITDMIKQDINREVDCIIRSKNKGMLRLILVPREKRDKICEMILDGNGNINFFKSHFYK